MKTKNKRNRRSIELAEEIIKDFRSPVFQLKELMSRYMAGIYKAIKTTNVREGDYLTGSYDLIDRLIEARVIIKTIDENGKRKRGWYKRNDENLQPQQPQQHPQPQQDKNENNFIARQAWQLAQTDHVLLVDTRNKTIELERRMKGLLMFLKNEGENEDT